MAWVPKLGGAKVILDIHDILPELYCQKFNKTRQSYTAKFALIIEKLSVACADHVIVANDLWKDKLQIRTREAPKKFTTILNYPREELLARAGLKSPTKYFTIIYPGTISHHHGVDIAVKAMPLVIKEIPLARFYIYGLAGNMNYYHHLKSLINSLELNEYVKLFDQVQHEKLLKIYETMSVGVVPKREGIFSSEAFSTKIFDFMAVGLPVVVSRTKIDLCYFDSSMVRYFEPGNHQDLARCIIELYQNSDRRNSMVQKAMQFIGDNNWTVKKDIYYRIIDQLCGSISKHAI
jgi:glycosyltransferase involved in cell wall biosynthesis